MDEWEADNPGQIDYFGGKSLLTQSHGQSLMSFFKARYKIKGLYLLDEPETALSPRSQLELLKLLQEMSAVRAPLNSSSRPIPRFFWRARDL